ncbi:DNA primase family protein [Ktedonobacter racemifer]|uniref:Phage/plasmid primase, P4 family n=1 Tax=Ktedonobacter racemifer DSM 44963 TaxID=485913 RepID=D6U554_KTERA|nr:phage/plasmid primase, P4 family [Ktedonobacter racemifer]EFH81634.1 phage/plasmid primase, P4 family [Ktedonobacter racemifer DSM 44963]
MNTKVQKSILTQVTGCSELMDFSADDGGNADTFEVLYGSDFLHVPELGWLHYNGKFWEQDRAALVRAVEDTLVQRRLEAVRCDKEKIVGVTKRDVFRIDGATKLLESRLNADIEDFDNNPDLLNVANGVVELSTGDLAPHDPSQRFTYALATDYDPMADSSEWEAFLSQAVTPDGQEEDKELLNFIQQAVGYSVTGHTREERLFYVYGPTRSGKGTFTESLMTLVPRPLSMEVDFNTFTARRDGNDQNFDLADMKPSRLIFASESNKYQSLNPGKIKQLTGGNWVQAAFKHKQRFSYRPQYAVWLSSNHKVMGDPEDDALWYRVLVVEFPNSHKGKEDTSLKARLKQPEAQRGILKWVVDGAFNWYATERLQVPEGVKLATQAHRDDLDNIALWINDEVIEEDGAFASSAELYQSYKPWCEDNGVEPKKSRELGLALKKRGYEDSKDYILLENGKRKQVRGWRGVRVETSRNFNHMPATK